MNHDDKIDTQPITVGMRDRIESIRYDVEDIDVLIELARQQVWDIKQQIENGITKFADGDFRAAFALLDITKRELERVRKVSEDFAMFDVTKTSGAM